MDIDNLKERLQGFGTRVQNGLRRAAESWTTSPGAAPQAAPEPIQIAPKQGQVVQPSGPTINVDSNGNARIQGQTLRSPNLGANPNIPPGGMSPEAAALRSAPASPPPPAVSATTPTTQSTQPTQPAKPGMLRGLAGGLLKGGAALGLGVEAVKAFQEGGNPMDAQIGDELAQARLAAEKSFEAENPTIAKGLRMASKLTPQGMLGIGPKDDQEQLNGQSALYGTIAGTARRIGNGLSLGFNVGDKVVGGIRDLIKGQPLGTTSFNTGAPAINPTVSYTEGKSAPPASSPQVANTGAIKTDQGDMSPEALMRGNAVPNPGYGAISTNGKTRGLRPSGYTAAELGYLHGRDNPGGSGGTDISALRALSKQGVFGGMAAMGGLGAIQRLQSNATSAGLRSQQIASTNALKLAEMERAERQKQIENARADRNELRQDREFANKTEQQNAADFDKELDSFAAKNVGNAGLTESGGKQLQAAEKAKLKEIAEYSVADSKDAKGKPMSLKNLSQSQRQQLYEAMSIKRKVEEARSGWMQSAADYLGTGTRVDSKNAYGYMPKAVEPATRPGESWIVTMQNGNKIALKELAGGQFQVLGPNTPVDADMMKYIAPLIEQRKKGK